MKKVPKIKETIADSLIRMLRLGPEVSFNGSPTVSPTTAAVCGFDFFSKNNLVLSSVLSVSRSAAKTDNLPAKIY